jgi:hypothetical protein
MQRATAGWRILSLFRFRVVAAWLMMLWAANADRQDWNQKDNIWDHNGSVVFLEWKGATRNFYYRTPRPAVAIEGVQSGTLLFTGTRSGYNYIGTAYIFYRRCGPIPYPVRGSLSSDLHFIRLAGRAPRLDANCNIVSYFDDVLKFAALMPPNCSCDCPGEIPIADFDEYTRTGAAYCCPYLYAWSDSEMKWRSYGKVLHIAEGRPREAVEQVELKEFSTRFRLAEEEPENAFIDQVELRLAVRDGAILSLKPDAPKLSSRDGIYASIRAYKSIDFQFTLQDWLNPRDVRHSTLLITGYYQQVLPPARLSRN